MTAVIKSALLDKYPEGLPVWTYAFMEGIDQLELSKTKDDVTTNIDAAPRQAGVKEGVSRMERAASGSPLTDCGSVDMERESDRVDHEVEVEQEPIKTKTFREKAESNFRTAIRLSHGKEVLPYTWLSFSLMQSDRWSEARETLCEAPLTTPLLFRLVTCYEHEKDYVKAYKTMDRAIQLTPDDERAPHAEHLKRLGEQAKDMAANIFRGDPFEMLPLEVIINIMHVGREMKDDFVLKASWVNQRWRQTLTQNCPELWRTLTIGPLVVKSKAAVSKAQTWQDRAVTGTDSMIFRDFNVTALQQLPSQFRTYVKAAKKLTIGVTEEAVLERFAEKYRSSIYYLESLTIKVAVSWRRSFGAERSRAERLRMSHEGDLCFLINHRYLRDRLESIEIHDASFIRHRFPSDSPVDRVYVRDSNSDDTSYPALKKLVVHHCAFDNVYNESLFIGTALLPPLLKYQCDPLHSALRNAPALEHLVVKPQGTREGKSAWPGLGQRITLLRLETAVLPPPSVWSIDIIAPNLTSLHFELPDGYYFHVYDYLHESRQTPLIPAIGDSPILLETLSRLQHVGFVCYFNDIEARLEEWLSTLSSMKSLTLQSIGGKPWPSTTAAGSSDQRAAVNVVQMLIDHPERCPDLQDLELDRCFATGDNLVQLVRIRNQSSKCVNLQRLTVRSSLSLTKKARRVLQKELSSFQQVDTCNPGAGELPDYWKDDFEEEISAEART